LKNNILQSAPFVRIAVLFLSGILFAVWVKISVLVAGLVFFTFLALLFFLRRSKHYITVWFTNYLLGTSIWAVGFFYAKNRELPVPKARRIEPVEYIAQVLETPIEKANSWQVVMKVENPVLQVSEKIIAYFQKTCFDTALKPGDNLRVRAALQLVENRGNPYEFDYKGFLIRKNIRYSAYLADGSWTKIGEYQRFNLLLFAENCRARLMMLLDKAPINPEEKSVVEALVLGYRKDLSPDTLDYFASAGAMHVLAVSGLHVGLVYLLLCYLLFPLKKWKSGQIFYTLSVVLCLFFYALLTGFSPSVQRATFMFTFIVIGDNLNKRTNIFNSLAASAFVLMLINPWVVFELGFQLSYLAVVGIVVLQPMFGQIADPKNYWVKKAWLLLTVSMAAQIATAPLSIHYFNQFPNLFWLSNFIVIPATWVILVSAFVFLACSAIPFLAAVPGFILQKSTMGMLEFLKWIDSIPFAVSQNIVFSNWQIAFLFVVIAASALFIQTKRKQWFFIALSGCLFFAVSGYVYDLNLLNQQKIFSYKTKGTQIHLINGRRNYLLVDQSFANSESIRPFDAVVKHLKLTTPEIIRIDEVRDYQSTDLLIRDNRVVFLGYSFRMRWNYKTKTYVIDPVKRPAELNPVSYISGTKMNYRD
jgi:competence protein ComEC